MDKTSRQRRKSADARRGEDAALPAASTPSARAENTARRNGRAAKSAARRDAIAAAALEEFCARGFAAARLDDVAKRAGVAKGTIYLHFRDKEALFENLVATNIVPFVRALETPPPDDVPVRIVLDKFVDMFVQHIYATPRRQVLRLVMTEGPRFPKLAEFYYHHVVERALAAMRALLTRARARGEIASDALVQFPQLVVAPALVAIIWSGLFDRFAPLDVTALMRAHLDLLFGEGGGS